eukprot:TRINITY_DN7286_c0_g1_i1.p1 TRINITY_DN7286_c0_g1~~TRINITY_DN7286_c0_g1_i1.p1  ORF type:complete len:448 (+),score=153.04 TRINITY_DN7286_c0_g1_i1:166-1509(+)
MQSVVVFLALVGATAGKLITNLPGLDHAINFKQYADYVTVDATSQRNLFYWFVESQNDPSTDPLVLWMNGGPGCSSILGFMTEHGPFQVKSDKSLKLEINPNSWNRVANIIYIEAPAGVGFSYSLNTSDYNTDDDRTADDNYRFLLGWFQQFPQFQGREFFIAGESYAGHYVPQLAVRVLQGNQDGNLHINLQGTMAGNPSTTSFYDGNTFLSYLTQHGFISIFDYDNAYAACGGNFVGNTSAACTSIVQLLLTSYGTRINPYNVFADCIGPGPSQPGYCFTLQSALSLSSPAAPTTGSQTMVPCIPFNSTRDYMDQPAVRKALYVSENAFAWDLCSQHLNYSFQYPDMVPLYNELVRQVRVLFYSGDADTCVNFMATQLSVAQIVYNGTRSTAQPWMVDGQVAGYKTQYGSNPVFATVKGAGHMVATYRPTQALALFSRFISGQPL